MPPLLPEFFLLLGVDLFLTISLLTCLLEKHFPWQLPILYQAAALAGYGQLMVSRSFMGIFDDYMRFWYSLSFLVVALVNIIAINAYLGFMKKLIGYAKTFLFVVTVPALAIATFFVSTYAQIAIHPIIIGPALTWEGTFVVLVAFDTLVVGIGAYVFFKPKWWYIAAGAGTAITGAAIYTAVKPASIPGFFLTSAIGLAVACIIVLTISIYVLARIWMENLRNKRAKGGEKRK